MNYNKINSHIILLLIVLIVSLGISFLGRLIVLEKGIDTGSANLIFIIILSICAVIYMIIIASLSRFVIPWINKIFLFRQNTQEESEELNEIETEQLPIIIAETSIPEQDYENIKQDYERSHIDKLTEKINLFQRYTNLTMAPYITKDELEKLHSYIICYVTNMPFPKDFSSIKVKKLKNPDLFHFGWNMTHFFEKEKQEVVPWLKKVFENLQDLGVSYVKGKLYDSQTRQFIIPNIDNIPKFLAQKDK